MHKKYFPTILSCLAVTLFVLPGHDLQAQTQKTYQAWSNPDQTASPRMNELLDQLDSLTKKAEKARAADPQFLLDLKNLSSRYRNLPSAQILFDNFSDGDFTRNPAWTVTEGQYFLEKGWGLRNKVETRPTMETSRKLKGKDLAIALFGQILNQSGGQTSNTSSNSSSNTSSGQSGQQDVAQPTAIYTKAIIGNAFEIKTNISSWAKNGILDIAVYQGTVQAGVPATGYHLQYQTSGKFRLIRVSGRGQTTLASSPRSYNLQDKKVHSIWWQRSKTGFFRVYLDGTQIIQSSDMGFRDRFDGVKLSTQGGDFIFRDISVSG